MDEDFPEDANSQMLALMSEVLEPEGSEIQDQITDVDEDGWIYDINSGEILGRADAHEKFVVDSVGKAEWTLQLRSKIDGDLLALQAREAALLEQLHAIRSAIARRKNWWEWKLAPTLIEFARAQLTGKNGRTARFSWGSVSFRSTAGTNQIVAMDQAVAWMRCWAPERVKSKTIEAVSIKDVLKTIKEVAAKFDEEPEAPGWLKSEGGGENVNISTGIDLTPKAKGKK